MSTQSWVVMISCPFNVFSNSTRCTDHVQLADNVKPGGWKSPSRRKGRERGGGAGGRGRGGGGDKFVVAAVWSAREAKSPVKLCGSSVHSGWAPLLPSGWAPLLPTDRASAGSSPGIAAASPGYDLLREVALRSPAGYRNVSSCAIQPRDVEVRLARARVPRTGVCARLS